RFDLRFLRADLSIKKSSSFFPPLIAATNQRGLAPRPAQVSPEGPRYRGGIFFPFNALPPLRATLATPTTATSILANCCSMSARRLRSVSSTRSRKSMSASTLIPDRFTCAIAFPLAARFHPRECRSRLTIAAASNPPHPDIAREHDADARRRHGLDELLLRCALAGVVAPVIFSTFGIKLFPMLVHFVTLPSFPNL